MEIDRKDLQVDYQDHTYVVSRDNVNFSSSQDKKGLVKGILEKFGFGYSLSYSREPCFRGSTFLYDLKFTPKARKCLGEDTVEALEAIVECHNKVLHELNKYYRVDRRK